MTPAPIVIVQPDGAFRIETAPRREETGERLDVAPRKKKNACLHRCYYCWLQVAYVYFSGDIQACAVCYGRFRRKSE
ncbi:MAG TPA: hypothetical protein VK540_08125 [Polyangiaceae bacterium]|nr:hypothetical protein [Polyangiaceae bacterium]